MKDIQNERDYRNIPINKVGIKNLRYPITVRDRRDGDGVSAGHAFLNRNKRSLGLDMKKPGAVDVVKRLIQTYDIVLEQFRPGVMGRLGLGYEDLSRENPSLIYCSLSGYGQTGPYRDRVGHDNNYLSVTGINGYSAREDGRPPVMGVQIADLAGGSLHAVIGILAAVNQRQHSGKGQYVDTSIADGTFALNVMMGIDYLGAGIPAENACSWVNGGTHYDYYRTKDKRYLSVGALEPHFLSTFCRALGGDELFQLASSQNKNSQRDFKKTLADIFVAKTLDEWVTIFDGLEACVEPVYTFAEACDNEQILERSMIVNVRMPDGGQMKQIGSPFKLSNSPVECRTAGGVLGADNHSFIQELGLGETDREALLNSGAFGPVDGKHAVLEKGSFSK